MSESLSGVGYMRGSCCYRAMSKLIIVNFMIGIILCAVVQWLSCCATNRKVSVSIPSSVSGFFIDIISF